MQKYNFRPRKKMPTGTPENSTQPEHGNFQAEIMATVHEQNEEIEALKLRVEAEKTTPRRKGRGIECDEAETSSLTTRTHHTATRDSSITTSN